MPKYYINWKMRVLFCSSIDFYVFKYLNRNRVNSVATITNIFFRPPPPRQELQVWGKVLTVNFSWGVEEYTLRYCAGNVQYCPVMLLFPAFTVVQQMLSCLYYCRLNFCSFELLIVLLHLVTHELFKQDCFMLMNDFFVHLNYCFHLNY